MKNKNRIMLLFVNLRLTVKHHFPIDTKEKTYGDKKTAIT